MNNITCVYATVLIIIVTKWALRRSVADLLLKCIVFLGQLSSAVETISFCCETGIYILRYLDILNLSFKKDLVSWLFNLGGVDNILFSSDFCTFDAPKYWQHFALLKFLENFVWNSKICQNCDDTYYEIKYMFERK